MSEPALQRIATFHLVTLDLDRLVRFYADVLGFAAEGGSVAIGEEEMALLGLAGSGVRQRLRLGAERIAIETFDVVGRPYPRDGNAASLDFQHLAIPVADIAAAVARLAGATPISPAGPSRLPASSGGVTAFKFRDPDGHPLEFLQFPPGGSPRWTGAAPPDPGIGLGIDHSAISVSDAAASIGFYERLGLRAVAGSRNVGPAQDALDGLANVEVDVRPLEPPSSAPHLELLAYLRPRGAAGPPLRPSDVAATRIGWTGLATALLRDPDGHLQQVTAPAIPLAGEAAGPAR